MDIDTAVEIVNDPSLTAYCDYVHELVYRSIGEYAVGFDSKYDTVALAYAYIAVELALNEEEFEFMPTVDD